MLEAFEGCFVVLRGDTEGMNSEVKPGEVGLVMGGEIRRYTGYNISSAIDYNADLTDSDGETDFDIMRIYRLDCMGTISDGFNLKHVKLVWERESGDWDNVPKYTKVQVRDYAGEEWQNRYFIRKTAGSQDYPFVTTVLNGDFIEDNDEDYTECFRYCRLYEN